MPLPQTGQLTRVSYPLPPRMKRVRSGIERAPKRIWLRHRKFVRSHRCVVPGCQALQVDFHHIRDSANAGISLKPHDQFGVPLCRNHHDEHHSCGVHTFEDRHGIDLYAIAAEFVVHRRQPRAARLERPHPRPDHRQSDGGTGDQNRRTDRAVAIDQRNQHPATGANAMITKQPSIAAAWASYQKLVLHPQAPKEQVADIYLAFWGGAATLFYTIMDCLDPGEEPTVADLKRMDNIHQEIERFAKTFDEEVLKRHGGRQ